MSSIVYNGIVYNQINMYFIFILFLFCFVLFLLSFFCYMTRQREYRELTFSRIDDARIKLAGLTVSTKAQTACHYGTGRINITDNRAASYAFKADVTTAPRFHVLRTPHSSTPTSSNEYYYYYRRSFLVSILK